MQIIIKGKHDHFGKTRSEQEKNMRKEWGSTMNNEQLSKLKYLEKKRRDTDGSKKNFTRAQDIDNVR